MSLKIKDVFTPTRGIFTNIDYTFSNLTYQQLDILFLVNYGERGISTLIENYIDENNTISNENLDVLRGIFLAVNKDHWDRITSAFNERYDIIHNYLDELTESSSIVNSGEESNNNTITETANNGITNNSTRTDNLSSSTSASLNKTRTDNLLSSEELTNANTKTYDTTDTTVKTDAVDSLDAEAKTIFGFDSSQGTPSENVSKNVDSTTTTNSTVDNTGTVTDRGSDTKSSRNTGTQDTEETNEITVDNTGTQINQKTVSETISSQKTNSGSNTSSLSKDITRTVTHSGNIGNIATQDLLIKELELAKKKLVDYLLNDAKELLTLSIYY